MNTHSLLLLQLVGGLAEAELRQLVGRLRTSDESAFKELFDEFQQGIFSFLRYKIGDAAVAEDVIQEVFIKLWENRHTLDESRSIKSYLFTIANNLALNNLRHRKVVIQFQQKQRQEVTSYADSPEAAAEANELREKLLHLIAGLPEKTRVVFMMSRFDELANKEIAARLEISVSTVENHMNKALRILRENI